MSPASLRTFGRIAEEPVVVGKERLDEATAAQIVGAERLGEKPEQIARLLDRLGPVSGRRGDQIRLELFLPGLQRGEIFLDLDPLAAEVGRPLRGHAAPPVEIDGLIRHPIFQNIPPGEQIKP